MKTYLITGGTGFLGEALIERLYNPLIVNLRVVSRNEGKLIMLKQKYPEIEIITGDISDTWIAKKACCGVDKIFHLAAMKSVDIAEKQTYECISTNIVGTINLLNECYINKPESIIAISTDKAAQISGVYGATKFLMEKLFNEAETLNPDTNYRVVRYGNVLYSTGSVLIKWRDKIRNGEKVQITNPDMTRFFWTCDQAIDLIFDCMNNSQDSKPMIPKMKSLSIGDLLDAMILKYGKGKNIEVEVIGNRGGENLHETMDGKNFSNEVDKFTVNEIIELI